EPAVCTPDRLDRDGVVVLDVHRGADGGELAREDLLQAVHRREAPVLLATRGNGEVGQGEGGTPRGPGGLGGGSDAVAVRLVRLGSGVVGRQVLLGGACGSGHQPTAPSICSSMRRLSSRAYSIGSSRAMGSTKPRTIIAIASVSSRPRDMR